MLRSSFPSALPGSFFLLTQLGLNNQQAQRDGDPRVTSNCWANEFDFLEGTGGWCAYGLKRNINDLFMTDSAQYLATACMAILGPRQSAVSRVFGAHCTTWSCCEGVNYCPADAPYAAFVGDNATVAKSFASFVGNDGSGGDWTIQPDCYNRSTIEAALAAAARNSSLGAQLIGPANLDLGGCGSYIVNGGAETNSYWTAGKGVRYMYAFVVDKLGVWGYRWRPEQFSPSPWPGLTPKEAATTLSDSRPTYRPPDGSLELVRAHPQNSGELKTKGFKLPAIYVLKWCECGTMLWLYDRSNSLPCPGVLSSTASLGSHMCAGPSAARLCTVCASGDAMHERREVLRPLPAGSAFCIRLGGCATSGWQLPRYWQHACRANDSLSCCLSLASPKGQSVVARECRRAAVPPCRRAAVPMCRSLFSRWGDQVLRATLHVCDQSARTSTGDRSTTLYTLRSACRARSQRPTLRPALSECCAQSVNCFYLQGGEGPELVGPL